LKSLLYVSMGSLTVIQLYSVTFRLKKVSKLSPLNIFPHFTCQQIKVLKSLVLRNTADNQ